MKMTVGENSYITMEDADKYIKGYLPSSNEQRTAWDKLNEEKKKKTLIDAARAIEKIDFIGIKKDSEQSLSFPRCYKNGYHFPIEWYVLTKRFGRTYHCQVAVPEYIKRAQILEALELVSPLVGRPRKSKGETGTPEGELKSVKAQRLAGCYVYGCYQNV